jgi:hypothetical protein
MFEKSKKIYDNDNCLFFQLNTIQMFDKFGLQLLQYVENSLELKQCCCIAGWSTYSKQTPHAIIALIDKLKNLQQTI